jgi:hypothetical protein
LSVFYAISFFFSDGKYLVVWEMGLQPFWQVLVKQQFHKASRDLLNSKVYSPVQEGKQPVPWKQ